MPAEFLKKYKTIGLAKEECKQMERQWREEYEKDPLKCGPVLS